MSRPIISSLDRERLVSAAFLQLEEDGLDGLSMRRVAARLNVQAPALYWHVRDKAELLGLMVRDIYAGAHDSVDSAPDWRSWLIQFGLALRNSVARHKDGARLIATAAPPLEKNPVDAAALVVAPLIGFGLSQAEALSRQAAVISLAVGWATFQANDPLRAFLDETIDFEACFEVALTGMIDGMHI